MTVLLLPVTSHAKPIRGANRIGGEHLLVEVFVDSGNPIESHTWIERKPRSDRPGILSEGGDATVDVVLEIPVPQIGVVRHPEAGVDVHPAGISLLALDVAALELSAELQVVGTCEP